jgi:hypothetical protein
MDRIVNVSNMVLGQPKEARAGKKKTSTSKKKTDDQSKNAVARSNNTVEATFTLTAYTLLGGVSNETVNDQHASND